MIWLDGLLLLVFAVHLVLFGRLAVRRRQGYYVAVTATFALLVAAFSLKIAAPHLAVGELPLSRLVRYAAWGSAAVSIGWAVARRLSRPGQKQ